MNKTIIASRSICNTLATVIYNIESGTEDKVLVGTVGLEKEPVPHWCKIRYNSKGEPYFLHYGRREYLSEYMQMN